MKKVKWVNDNKMLFESEHKTFNRAIKCISRGNVMGDTQLSGFTRSYEETECNGFQSSKGHLQNYDLDWLNKHLPYELKDWIRAQDKVFIGYTFFYWKDGKRIFIGWVVTCLDKLVRKEYARYTRKTISALDECIKYITN